MDIEYKVEGIDCANCAMELEERISKIKGVKEATLNFLTQKLNVEAEDDANQEEIKNEIVNTIRNNEPDATIEEL